MSDFGGSREEKKKKKTGEKKNRVEELEKPHFLFILCVEKKSWLQFFSCKKKRRKVLRPTHKGSHGRMGKRKRKRDDVAVSIVWSVHSRGNSNHSNGRLGDMLVLSLFYLATFYSQRTTQHDAKKSPHFWQ